MTSQRQTDSARELIPLAKSINWPLTATLVRHAPPESAPDLNLTTYYNAGRPSCHNGILTVPDLLFCFFDKNQVERLLAIRSLIFLEKTEEAYATGAPGPCIQFFIKVRVAYLLYCYVRIISVI